MIRATKYATPIEQALDIYDEAYNEYWRLVWLHRQGESDISVQERNQAYIDMVTAFKLHSSLKS